MREEAVLYFHHRVRYTTSRAVSVEDVVDSLRGTERIVQAHLPKALKKLTKTKIKRAELLVTGIEDGSLIDDFLIKVVFDGQEEADKFYKKVHGMIPASGTTGRKVVNGVFVGAVVVTIGLAGLALVNAAFPDKDSGAAIQGDGNIVISIGAEAFGKNPEQFRKIVTDSLSAKQQESAARAAVQMFRPGTSEDGAGMDLESDGESYTVVPPGLMRRVPREIESEDTSEDQSIRNVQIKIRASDTDSGTRGWAGTIDRIAEQRTRIVFANPLDASKAQFSPSINADVTVTYSDASKARVSLIIVERVL